MLALGSGLSGSDGLSFYRSPGTRRMPQASVAHRVFTKPQDPNNILTG